MKTPPDPWPQLDRSELSQLNEATEQVHRAAQFLSMAGKFFVPNQPDDSHTNMGWNLPCSRFEGHLLPTGHRMALYPESMDLLLLDAEGAVAATYALPGKTWAEGVQWVRETLGQWGIYAAAYEIDLHYELPDHAIHHGAPFQAPDSAGYAAFSKVRSLGHLVMTEWAGFFSEASPVRTWPHHFDIGSYMPLEWDAEGAAVKSISIGLSIADTYVDEYYFYLTHWSQADDISYESLVQLPACGFWNRKDFTGALLRLSDLMETDGSAQQYEQVSVFMQEGLRASLDLLELDAQPYFS